jgi:cell division protein ZapA
MSAEAKPVTVSILDKEYVVACPDDERESLHASADLLNSRMRELRDSGKVLGNERVAVMAALNIAHEHLEYKRKKETYSSDVGSGIHRIQTKIADALKRGPQLPFADSTLETT